MKAGYLARYWRSAFALGGWRRGRGGCMARGGGDVVGEGARGWRRRVGRIDAAGREGRGARTPSTRASARRRSFSRGGVRGCRRGCRRGVPTGCRRVRVATVHAGGCD